MASMIQVNVKKDAISHDDVDSTSVPIANGGLDFGNEKENIPMIAASIESWGGLRMRCIEAGSSVHAADFG